MKNSKILLIGGGILALAAIYFFIRSRQASAASPVQANPPGTVAAPADAGGSSLIAPDPTNYGTGAAPQVAQPVDPGQGPGVGSAIDEAPQAAQAQSAGDGYSGPYYDPTAPPYATTVIMPTQPGDVPLVISPVVNSNGEVTGQTIGHIYNPPKAAATTPAKVATAAAAASKPVSGYSEASHANLH